MLSDDPSYFPCVLTSCNYALFLLCDSVPSVISRSRISCAPHKPGCDDTRHCCICPRSAVITRQPHRPPRVARSLTRQRSRERRKAFYTLHLHGWVQHTQPGPGPASTAQTLASVDKDKPQPSPTWQSSGLCKSLIWHSCLTLNGVFLPTWQPSSQCYDRKLFTLHGGIAGMHV